MDNDRADLEMTPELQQSLDWATASIDAPEAGMDPQAAALREAWAAWGRLLDSFEAVQPLPSPMPSQPARKPRFRLFGLVLASGIAAVVSGTIWFAIAGRRVGPPTVVLDTATRGPLETIATQARSGGDSAAKDASAVASADPDIDWDDAVDGEIADLGKQLLGLEDSWRVRLGPEDAVWCGIMRIQREIESERL